MNENERQTLTRLHSHIVRALHVDEDFLDEVYSQKLFSENQMYDIRAKETPREKTINLLMTLRTRGPQAFSKFIAALKKCGRVKIAQALELKLAEVIEERKNQRSSPLTLGGGTNDDSRDLTDQALSSELCGLLPTDKRNEPVLSDSEVYTVSPISDGYRGQVLLINNVVFDRQQIRKGSDLDAVALHKLFATIGFKVQEENNKTGKEMKTLIKKFLNDQEVHGRPISTSDGQNPQVHVAMVCILTHGSDGAVSGVDGVKLKIDKIISWMTAEKCSLLAGKPKWLFIQACRGRKTDMSVHNAGKQDVVHDGPDLVADAGVAASVNQAQLGAEISTNYFSHQHKFDADSQDARAIRNVPADADILISYATCSEYAAWRSEDQGSWYVQDFCKVLTQKSGEKQTGPPRWEALDVATLLTLVNNEVTKHHSSSQAVQTSEFQSRLRKVLYLKPESRAKWTL